MFFPIGLRVPHHRTLAHAPRKPAAVRHGRRIRCARFAWLATVLASTACMAQADIPHKAAVDGWIADNLDEVVTIYRQFHMRPELSFQERETAASVGAHWRRAGFEVTQEVGGFGVVGILKNGEGPTLMLRTDLDALPVTEATNLVYASKVRVKQDGGEVGVMHACGHDIHIANLIGVARFMAANKKLWNGTLLLIGQPAEERGAGAKAMLNDGLFKRFPKPDAALALHVDSTIAAGDITYLAGYTLANVDSVDILLKGKGGHGAQPHTTIDPVVLAAELVLSLQTIVSREVNPTEPAVITVGSIHAGSKHNIISDTCRLQLTVRSYSDDVRQHLLDAIKRKAKAVAEGARAAEPEVKYSEGTPAMKNDADLAAQLGEVFRQSLGAEHVSDAKPSMGGEDFSQYGRAGVPILMYRLGAVERKRLERLKQLGQQPPSLHSSTFYPDAKITLATGLKSMTHAALTILQ